MTESESKRLTFTSANKPRSDSEHQADLDKLAGKQLDVMLQTAFSLRGVAIVEQNIPVMPTIASHTRGKRKTEETLLREPHIRSVFAKVGQVNEEYCRKLDAALLAAEISPTTRESWRTGAHPCPDSYVAAWRLSDLTERRYFRKQIRNECKHIIARPS